MCGPTPNAVPGVTYEERDMVCDVHTLLPSFSKKEEERRTRDTIPT